MRPVDPELDPPELDPPELEPPELEPSDDPAELDPPELPEPEPDPERSGVGLVAGRLLVYPRPFTARPSSLGWLGFGSVTTMTTGR